MKTTARLEESLVTLGAENERLHGLQKERFKENDSLKRRIVGLEKTIIE